MLSVIVFLFQFSFSIVFVWMLTILFDCFYFVYNVWFVSFSTSSIIHFSQRQISGLWLYWTSLTGISYLRCHCYTFRIFLHTFLVFHHDLGLSHLSHFCKNLQLQINDERFEDAEEMEQVSESSQHHQWAHETVAFQSICSKFEIWQEWTESMCCLLTYFCTLP